MNKLCFLILFSVVLNSLHASEYNKVRKATLEHSQVWQSFALSDVQLTGSYFKQAMDLHKQYILSLEVDRLIPHVRRNAGLEPKGKNYGGWETHGGCTYGHYMSSCALMYAATGEDIFMDKLNYMLSELETCQKQIHDGWFLGGKRQREGLNQLMGGSVALNQPDETKQPWNFNQNGNSWYGIHKVLSGLRDAYIYAGSEKAKEILMPLADFIAQVALNSNSDLFQSILSVEQGGMNEVFADIYSITGDKKYLKASERFNHINVIYPTANGEDVLSGRHANDQIPKFIGVARQYEYTQGELYRKAAENFWDIVIRDHTLVIGGNSCYERFGLPGQESKRLDCTSAETCNTYNMLKLSRQLFMLSGDSKYLNYYEHALYNHILASQDPDKPGGVTYYTSLMPGSYKQYSTPYESFWCCVGSGMENHAKYAESVYFRNNQNLLVNLYIPSVLNWKETGLQLTMHTAFPESDTVQITVNDKGDYSGSLLFRYPEWVKGNISVYLNKQPAEAESTPGKYIRLLNTISDGDEITLVLPRSLYIDYSNDEPYFGSLLYGPILLSGGFGSEDMPNDCVSDNRALRTAIPEKNIPALVGSKQELDSWIVKTSEHPLRFDVKNGGMQKPVCLIPYFQMHHQRHTVYWKIYSPEEYTYRSKVFTDEVHIANEADEKRHKLTGINDSIYWHDYFWAKHTQYRMATNGGEFSYSLKIDKNEQKPYYLICRFWGDEPSDHIFDIYIDGKFLKNINLDRKLYLTYVDDIFIIPAEWTQGKSFINVTFRAAEQKKAGGLYKLKITSDPDFR